MRFGELLLVLRHRWRWVVGVPAVFIIFAIAYSLLLRPVYTATASFLPEQGQSSTVPAGLAGLASQFGVTVGGGGGPSARVYAEILRSRALTTSVLTSRYPAGADSVTLLDLLEIEGRNDEERLDRGIRTMISRVDVRVDNQTGMVRIAVEAPDRMLSAQVANRYVDYLNEFNAETRQSSARNRLRFVEGRIAEAESLLRRAEADLRAFYERNRQWQQSPSLVFEEGRQRRGVELRQEVYLTLAREAERARIEQVNDVAAITVVDRAAAPLLRSRPRRKKMVLVAAALGLVAGLAGAFVAHGLEGSTLARLLPFRGGTAPA